MLRNAEQKRLKLLSRKYIDALNERDPKIVPALVLWEFLCEHPQYYHDCGIFQFFEDKHFEEINTYFEAYTSFLSKRAENDMDEAFKALELLYDTSVKKVESSNGSIFDANIPRRLNLPHQTGQELYNFIQTLKKNKNDMKRVFRDLHGAELRILLKKIMNEGVIDACFKDVSNNLHTPVWRKICEWADTQDKRSKIALEILSVEEPIG